MPGPCDNIRSGNRAAALVIDRSRIGESQVGATTARCRTAARRCDGGGADHGLSLTHKQREDGPIPAVPVADQHCCPSGPGRAGDFGGARIPPAAGFGSVKFRVLNWPLGGVARHIQFDTGSRNSP